MSTLAALELEGPAMAKPTFDPPSGPFSPPSAISIVMGPKLIRADVPIICGFIPAGALIPENFFIPHRDPRTGRGYQRLPQESRVNELATDLRKGRVDLPTSILLNVRNRDARKALHDGVLDLRVVAGAAPKAAADAKFYVVDGQHRILALKKLIEDFDGERWSKYEIPFTCMLGATEEEEMDQFYIVNSKAKSVRTDLAYELLHQRAQDPQVMESLVERGQDWQVHAQAIVKKLNEDSPVWRGRIRFAAMEKGDTIMPSASMVSSLKQILGSPYFKVLAPDQQVKILDAYWRGIRNLLPEAFDEPSEFSLQKGVGVMVMHTVLMQVIEIARSQGLPLSEPETYEGVLKRSLETLQGDDATGNPVSGLDFWRAAPLGAAGSYSSSAGRRVLIAKIQMLLPKVTVQ
jgi:DGQHR domain-containing protein